jgi:hypothetical protein
MVKIAKKVNGDKYFETEGVLKISHCNDFCRHFAFKFQQQVLLG